MKAIRVSLILLSSVWGWCASAQAQDFSNILSLNVLTRTDWTPEGGYTVHYKITNRLPNVVVCDLSVEIPVKSPDGVNLGSVSDFRSQDIIHPKQVQNISFSFKNQIDEFFSDWGGVLLNGEGVLRPVACKLKEVLPNTPAPDPTPDPRPDPVNDPVPDPRPEPEPDPVAEPTPEPVPEPVVQNGISANDVYKVGRFRASAQGIRDLEMSFDGEQFLTIAEWGEIKLWNARTNGLVATLMPEQQKYAFTHAKFSADGRQVIVSSELSRDLKIYDAKSGHFLKSISLGGQGVSSLEISSRGKYLVAYDLEGGLHCVDIGLGRVIWNVRDVTANTAAFSSDESRVTYWVLKGSQLSLEVRGVAKGDVVAGGVLSLSSPSYIPGKVSFAPKSNSVVIAQAIGGNARGGMTHIIQIKNGAGEIQRTMNHSPYGIVNGFVVTKDSQLVFSEYLDDGEGSSTDNWHFVDLGTGRDQIRQISGHQLGTLEVYPFARELYQSSSLKYNFDRVILNRSNEGFQLVDTTGRTLLARDIRGDFNEITLSPNGQYLLVSLASGEVEIIDLLRLL